MKIWPLIAFTAFLSSGTVVSKEDSTIGPELWDRSSPAQSNRQASLERGADEGQAIVSFSGGSTFSAFISDETVGWSFSVAEGPGVLVNALGWWDETPSTPLAASHEVGIWTASGVLLGSATVMPNDPLTGSFRYASLSEPLALAGGTTYVIGGRDLESDGDNYITFVSGLVTNSQINFLQAARSATSSGFAFPSILTDNSGGRFGPNFQVGSASVGFDCASLSPIVGLWGEADGRCGNITSTATTPRFESARLGGGVTVSESRGGPMGYVYTVEVEINRPRQRTAANAILVHGSPLPLQSGAQWWNRMLAFNISGDGRYSIFRYNGTARPAAIQPWTAIIGTTVAVPPATNTLQVVSNGSTLSFVLNGVTLRTIPSEFAVEDFGIGFVRSVPGTGSAADDWIEIAEATVDAGTTIESGGDGGVGAVSAEQEAANLRASSADQLQVADPFFAPGETTRPRK